MTRIRLGHQITLALASRFQPEAKCVRNAGTQLALVCTLIPLLRYGGNNRLPQGALFCRGQMYQRDRRWKSVADFAVGLLATAFPALLICGDGKTLNKMQGFFALQIVWLRLRVLRCCGKCR